MADGGHLGFGHIAPSHISDAQVPKTSSLASCGIDFCLMMTMHECDAKLKKLIAVVKVTLRVT